MIERPLRAFVLLALVHFSAAARLYTLGISGILSAFEAASGRLLWRHDESSRVSTEKLFCGSSTSPLADRGLVIVHLGDDRGGFLVARDAATGEERWRWQGAGPGYASPIAVELGGTRQVVTLTDRSAVGVAATDGRLLWELPFPDEWNERMSRDAFDVAARYRVAETPTWAHPLLVDRRILIKAADSLTLWSF